MEIVQLGRARKPPGRAARAVSTRRGMAPVCARCQGLQPQYAVRGPAWLKVDSNDFAPWAEYWNAGRLCETVGAMIGENDPIGTVQRMFDAFRRGDLDGLVETVHPDSRWTYFGANPKPTRAEFAGRPRVRSFFERILSRLEILEFTTTEFIVEGAAVVVFGSESGTVRHTGLGFHNVWTQKYVVEDNLIVTMVEYNIQVEPRN